MNTSVHRLTVASVALVAFVLAAVAPVSWAGDREGKEREVSEANNTLEGKIVPLKDARIKIELNATASDAGIQVFIDSDPWTSMDVYDPYGRLVFRSTTRGRLAKQGGTELFLESAEPNFSQLPLEEFFERFPEGTYRFRGKGVAGEIFVGSAVFTHNLAAGPELVSPLEGGALVDPNNAAVTWRPVGAANGSPIVAYQVLIVQTPSTISAIPKIMLDVIMPATATSLAVPPGFLLPNTRYSWEVLAIEASGNQTISTAFFRTAP